jgi:hypothetical protein
MKFKWPYNRYTGKWIAMGIEACERCPGQIASPVAPTIY